MEILRTELNAASNAETENAKVDLAELQDKLSSEEDYQSAEQTMRDQIQQAFTEVDGALDQIDEIQLLREAVRRFKETEEWKMLATLVSTRQPSPSSADAETGEAITARETPLAPEYVATIDVSVTFGGAWIDSLEELEEYLSILRKALEKELKAGKRIQL